MQSGGTFRQTGSIRFRTTAWSLVLQAHDDEGREEAFDLLFRTYYRPVYALYRRAHQLSPEDASDLTQSFFLHLMNGALLRADPTRGRFRAFVKVAARNHFLDAKRLKSAAGALAPSHWTALLDDAKSTPPADPSLTAEEAFDRAFAERLVAAAVDTFTEACRQAGTDTHAQLIRLRYLEPSTDGTRGLVAAIAEELGIRPDQVSRQLYKAKQAFRTHLVAAVRATLPPSEVDDPDAVEEELSTLLRLMQG